MQRKQGAGVQPLRRVVHDDGPFRRSGGLFREGAEGGSSLGVRLREPGGAGASEVTGLFDCELAAGEGNQG